MKRYEETEKLLKNDRKSTRKGSTEMGYGVTTALSGQIIFPKIFEFLESLSFYQILFSGNKNMSSCSEFTFTKE